MRVILLVVITMAFTKQPINADIIAVSSSSNVILAPVSFITSAIIEMLLCKLGRVSSLPSGHDAIVDAHHHHQVPSS